MSFYESPLFIDVLLVSIYVLTALTVGLTAWSMLRTLRMHNSERLTMGIPAKRIAWIVALLLAATLALTALTADTQPLNINGHTFDNSLWLRVSDMLINTSTVLIVVAVMCVALSALGIGRLLKH
jgi:NADH:ubiquinone oxidoreductase subunit 6 (subunit J)